MGVQRRDRGAVTAAVGARIEHRGAQHEGGHGDDEGGDDQREDEPEQVCFGVFGAILEIWT